VRSETCDLIWVKPAYSGSACRPFRTLGNAEQRVHGPQCFCEREELGRNEYPFNLLPKELHHDGHTSMKTRAVLAIYLAALFGLSLPVLSTPTQAQTKEVQIVKVDPSMIKRGFRASKLIGSQVTNEKNEKIGQIDEIIIDAENKATFAVLDVGGFLGLGAHKIAVPYETLKIDPAGKRIDLPGSTKEALKALPEITYEQ